MLSHRSINSRRLAGLLCILALAGCATGPQPQTDAGQVDGQVPDGGQPVQTRDVPPRALTLFERAVAAMAAGDTIDAELRFQEFLLLYPDYASAHVNLAIIFAGRGDDQAAARSLADALNVSPEYPQALNQLGMLLRRQGKFQEAEAAYLKAVTASPNYALAHYNLGVLNDLYLQRLDVALVHYEKYQELSDADKQVSRWIADLKRRISATQRSANVTE